MGAGDRLLTETPAAALLTAECGEVEYRRAAAWQSDLAARREAGGPDVLLTLTHPRVFTAGRRADVAAHVLDDPRTGDVPVVRTNRGGDVTYHGPGQLVAYPIVGLPHAKAVRRHVEALEQACVDVAASYGVPARGATLGGDRRADRQPRTGVWVGEDKLAAIGVRVVGRTTSHGLAFNVAPDLADFAGIVPCGIPDAGVCSLASLGVDADLSQVRERLVTALAARLGRRPVPVSASELGLSDGPALRAGRVPASR